MSVVPLMAAAQESLSAAPSLVPSEIIVVRVTLNTEDYGDLFVGRSADGDFLVKVEDLKSMGIKQPAGSVTQLDGEPFLSLRSMRGLSFVFQERQLLLAITAEPQLLPSRAFGLSGQRGVKGLVPHDNSAFLNYAVSYAQGSSSSVKGLAFSGELGWRLGDYLLLSDGNTVQATDGSRRFIRLTSSVTRDDRESLQRFVAGDYVAPSRELSNGLALGGFSLSKRYGLDPYAIQFPTQNISGNVALPSDLEVYLDGQRISSQKLSPGGFQLNNILAYGGARSVELVLRDAFGRVQQLNYSFYFTQSALKQGLHEYSYNLGAVRRNYGIESSNYGPLAYSAFHRYGVSDWLTLGLHAEGTRQLSNAGPAATVVLGSLGVVNLSLSGSSIAGQRGGAGVIIHNYQAKNWNTAFSLRRDWGQFATLADPVAMTDRKYEGSASISYNLRSRGSVGLSQTVLTTYPGRVASPASPTQPFNVSLLEERRVTALSYSLPLSGKASLSASLSHVQDKGSSNEAFLGLILFLDQDYSAAANLNRDATGNTESLQFTKRQPIGEGFGYFVSADRSHTADGQTLQLRSTAQLNLPTTIWRGEVATHSDIGKQSNDYSVSVAGSLAYVAGNYAYGRPIADSFAIVKVGELADVGVMVSGQPVGKTDASGRLLVPTLSPYYDNVISLGTENVPIEYGISAASKRVSPSLRGGALIEFSANRMQAITGTLKYREGGELQPVEFLEVSLNVDGTPLTFQTGRGGEFYLDSLKAGTYAGSVTIEKKPCEFAMIVPSSKEMFVELPELVCRQAP